MNLVQTKEKGKLVLSVSEKHSEVFRKLNPLNANFTKWSSTLKQFVDKLPTNCLSAFDHFVGLALEGSIVLAQLQMLLQMM